MINMHANASQKSWLRSIFLFYFFIAVSTVSAQNSNKIYGIVSESSGTPMIGVSVTVKGTNIGTITDLNGNYQINASSNATLVYSFIGYKVKAVEVAGKSKINVSMEEDNKLLDEVVVVGYGIQKKSSVTGAISQMKSEDVNNRSITNAQQALQGKVAGVQVITSSGAPGSSPSIRIRGYSSNSDMSPLYVVDGIISPDISGVEPNDIESIEVLKDASSAAIYGAQAGNGVVLISTKKGKKSKNSYGKINYDYQLSSQSLARTPHVMNAKEYSTYMVEGGLLSQKMIDTYWDGKTDTNWADIAFGSSEMQKHNLSFTGGSEKSSFYMSLSYLDNNGIVKGNNDTYKRMNSVINADYQIKPWLKVGTNNNIEKYDARSVSEGSEYGSLLASVLSLDPLTPNTYTSDNLPSSMKAYLNEGKTLLQDANGNYYALSDFFTSENVHPFIMRDNTITKSKGFNVNGSAFGEFTPLKGLTVTSRLGYRLSSYDSNSYYQDYYAGAQKKQDYISMSMAESNTAYYQWDNFANYMTKIGGKHDVNVMAGHSFTSSTNTYLSGTAEPNNANAVLKDDPDLFGYLSYAASSASKSNTGYKTVNTNESYFGRLSYSYDNKYMAQFSMRADAFDLSKLPLTNRWGYFPAGSAAWVASNEDFWKPIANKITYLKIRTSWGKNGSIGALSNYLYSTDMASYNRYPFTTSELGENGSFGYVTGSRPSTMGNDKLSWETSTQFDLGFDARFVKDRLSLTFDYFNKTTNDLLVMGVTPSLIVGGTASPMNAGSVNNKGFELELNWRDRIGKDFSYSIRTNIATLKNKVTYLDKSIAYITGATMSNNPITIFEQGSEIWHFYGYQFTGINSANGEATFKDVNGDGSITSADRTNLGSAIPKYNYGITLTASYKGFDALVFGSGSQGNKIYQSLVRTDRLTGNRLYDEFYDNRWSSTNTTGTKPGASTDISKYLISNAMVKDGSFFKIKQIQLGYTIPTSLLKNIQISNLRLYVSLDDFFTFTNYKGFDPEACSAGTGSSQGVDKGTYPVSKKFVAGINITF